MRDILQPLIAVLMKQSILLERRIQQVVNHRQFSLLKWSGMGLVVVWPGNASAFLGNVATALSAQGYIAIEVETPEIPGRVLVDERGETSHA